MISIFRDKILDVTAEGVLFVSKRETLFISFPECTNNFSLEYGNNSGMCVAYGAEMVRVMEIPQE